MITDEEERKLRAEHAALMAMLRASNTLAWRAVFRDGAAGLFCGALGIMSLVVQYPSAGWWSVSIFCSGALLGLACVRFKQQRLHAKVSAFLVHLGDHVLEGHIAAMRRQAPGDAA